MDFRVSLLRPCFEVFGFSAQDTSGNSPLSIYIHASWKGVHEGYMVMTMLF